MNFRLRFPKHLLHLLALAALSLTTTALATAQAPAPSAQADDTSLQSEGKQWWAHVQYLADDKLEGRLTGSEGYRKAADYVANKFKEYGLKPAGEQGYFQPVKFDVQQLDEPNCSLALVRDGKTTPLAIGQDALLGARVREVQQLEAPLYFAGYALHIPEANFDDFSGQDLKGKVIVYIGGGPAEISGALKSHARAGQEFWKTVKASGAVGVISIPNPKSMDIPWSRMALSTTQPSMWIAEPELQDIDTPVLTGVINPESADKLLARSGHTVQELMALADSGKPLPHFAIPGTLKAKVATKTSTTEANNIIGVLPGSDSTLKNEYVVYSAHLDHLGVGQAINGDKIYNGAMDDGSGIASLLEIARMMHASNAKLKRSILFVAVTAEEKGLLGSRYFAAHPTVPAKSLVADLNMDMFLPLHPLELMTVLGLDESTLGAQAREVIEKDGVKVEPDQQPDRNLFIRSDQYNFIRKGVPSLAFKFGAEKGSPEEKMQKDWLTNRYHAPSDDVNQPVDLAGAAKFDRILMQLGETVANDPQRPQWNSNSFFKRFAQ